MPQPIVTVTAIKDFAHAGIQYVRGECFRIGVVDALILAQSRHVSLTKAVPPRQPYPIKKADRRYKRKDLTAERL